MKKLFALTLILFALAIMAGCDQTETVGAADSPIQVASLIQEHGYFDIVCRDAAGNVKWTETDHNALANEGEYLIEDVLFRGNTAPSNFYLRLYNTTPTLTSTLSSLSTYEATVAYGYDPASASPTGQTITRDSTGWTLVPQLATSHYEISTRTVTITASGGSIGPVTYAALATTSNNTGKLVAYAALQTTRTLSAGDSLAVTYKIRLQ